MEKTNKKGALALKYDKDIHNAPVIVSKVDDALVLKMLEIARKHNIPIVEDGESLSSLMELNVGDEIPYSLYEVVGVILSNIYKLKVDKN